MRKLVKLGHKGTDLFLIELLEIARPIVLVSEAPNYDSGVVPVLVDHIHEHPAGLLLVPLAAQTAAAPWNFFPYQKPKFITQVQSDAGLLMVSEADEIHTHLLHQLQLFSNQIFGQGSGEAGVIFVPVRPPQEQALAVQLEWSLPYKFEVPDAKAFLDAVFSVWIFERDNASVERGVCRRPQMRAFNFE